MTVSLLAQALGLEVLNMADPQREISGGYCGDLLSWVMGNAEQGNAWVTIMTNNNVAAVASLLDLACVVLAENSQTDGELERICTEKGITLLRSQKGSFELCAETARLIKPE